MRLLLCFLLLLPCIAPAFGQTEVRNSDGSKLSVEACLAKADEQISLKNPRQASWYLNQAAMTRWEEQKYEEALSHFTRSLRLNEEINNHHGVYGICSNMAMIYADMKQYEQSYTYFKRTLDGRIKEGKDKVSIISAHINTAVVLNNLKRHNEAAEHQEKALALAREMNDSDQMKSCYGQLSETYEKAGNTEKSLHYFNLYRTFHEMVQRDKEEVYKTREAEATMRAQLVEAEKRAQETELFYKEQELARRQRELSEIGQVLSEFDSANRELLEKADKAELLRKLVVAKDTEAIRQKEIIGQQQVIQYALIAGVVATGLMLFFVFRSYREKKHHNKMLKAKNTEIMEQQERIAEQNHELETAFGQIMRKNEKITQSINYAQRIQTAMMPEAGALADIFADSAILFQPRDIVSGDFYWFGSFQGRHVIVAADCTGHGVPGALVSMVGINLLTQIVAQEGITKPDEILHRLDEGIQSSLNQNNTQNQDGMDVALVCIDPAQKKLWYAGAKNPMIYWDTQQLQILKASKSAVGGSVRRKRSMEASFECHEIDLKKGMAFYLFSDGMQDQFGGQHSRKLMLNGLKDLIAANVELPMPQQIDALRHSLAGWMRRHEQIDDMLMIGFKPIS